MNILFLAPAWKASLIKAFQEARKSMEGDIRLIAADSDALSSSIYFADRFHIVPMFDSPDFNSHFLDLCKKEKLTAIVPLSDKAISVLENLRPDLKKMDILPIISSAETIRNCLDKWETYRFCKNHSIPTPETVLYDRKNHDIPIEFPLFLKKRTGEGSNDTCIIKTKEQFKALQLDKEYIVQQYIKGTEYTIDILSDFTGEPLSAVPRERIAVRGGEILKGKTVHNPELVQWGSKIAKILKFRGPANIQCIKNRQGNYFFTDINNRFGSGVVLTLAAGVNFPEMLFKLIKGEKVKNIIGSYEKNLFMLRYDEAVFTRNPGSADRDQGAEDRRQKTEGRISEIRNPKSKIQNPNQCCAAILQPGFLPWLGFFEQMYRCDVFVFLDNVQYTKRDWRSRNRIKTPEGACWLTLPVKTKSRYTQLIKDTELDNSQNWKGKHLNSIKMNYSRATYFDSLYPKIEEIYKNSWKWLYDIDLALIKLLMEELGLKRKLYRSSDIEKNPMGSSEERIVDICRVVGANNFYTGAAGCTIYNAECFQKQNILLELQDYRHPIYQQLWDDFIPYLSAIDLIFNHGPKSLGILLNKAAKTDAN